MKFVLKLLFLGTVAANSGTFPRHVPARISFEELARGGAEFGDDNDDMFWKSLREVGLLSVTDIPGFNKQSMLEDLEDCLHHQPVGAPEFAFDTHRKDHHQRRTLATRTLAGSPDDILVATTKNDENREKKPCGDLRASSQTFRRAVQTVSEAVAARFGAANSGALTNDATHRKIPIETLINEGEHLEHFHSYFSESRVASTAETTIDWHTDQGMMLLFTPGQRKDGTTLDGFFIKLACGSTVEVAFDSDIDDLIIMLGDGVRQYVNDGESYTDLRAVPHAVSLPHDESPRLWYGRMVLPPPKAIHPSGDRSFEDLRTAMIRGDSDALALGCAESSDIARELTKDLHSTDDGPPECDESVSMLCWMRCMPLADFDLSVDSCASTSATHKLQCANDDNELWMDGVHSDEYYLRCLAAENVTYPMGMDHSGMDQDHSGMHDDSGAASARDARTVLGMTALGFVLAVAF